MSKKLKLTKLETENVELQKAQRGWYCDVYFAIETRRQFTWERHSVRAYGREGWTGWAGALTAVVAGLWAARTEARRLQALPGEHNAHLAA